MLLHELQTAFAAAIEGEDMDALVPHITGDDIAAERRIEVYRNNVHHNRREALRAVFPVVESLVGTRFFDYAADRYIRIHPSTSGDIHRYGGSFANFLTGFAPAAQLAYLPDTARLEWAMHESFHAADHAALALDRLAQLPQSSHAALAFTLHPACRLLSSLFPVHRIWAWTQPGAEQEGRLHIDGEGVSLLVRRDAHAVELLPLQAAEYAMLQGLAAGRTVVEAYDSAVQADSGFELAPFILRHVALQTLVDFHVVPDEVRQARSAKNSRDKKVIFPR